MTNAHGDPRRTSAAPLDGTQPAQGRARRLLRVPALRAIAVISSSSVAAGIVGFIANVLMSRQLDPDQRGQVAFVIQTAYVIGPVLMLGVERAVLRPDRPDGSAPRTRHLVPMAFVVGAALFLVFRDLRALAAGVALTTAWLVIQRAEAIREHSFATYTRRFLAYQVFLAVSLVGLFLVGESRWYVWLIPYLVPALLVLAYEAPRVARAPRATFTAVDRVSLSLLPATLATILVLRAERVMLPLLASNDQLGLYVAVATATEPVYWIARTLADHRAGRDAGRNTRLPARLRRLSADAAVFTVIAALVGTAVWLLIVPLFGAAYEPARALVLPLSIAAVVLALNRLALSWHLAGPKPGDVSTIEAATAVVGLAAYGTAITLGGAVGAAWSTVAVYGFGLVIAIVVAGVRSRARSTERPG